ncbi:MAG TPA: hypothetical protein VFP84_35725 [Kofleriaceae bacterium]|nr:hypothetical protein [Kofleriaceae bacterium]
MRAVAGTVFLISPARCASDRARRLLAARGELGARLWEHSAPLGELFTWLSSLYFRGKLTYARRFGRALIMAPGLGLRAPELMVSAAMFRTMGTIEVESAAFVEPLVRDARLIAAEEDTRVVLLGSIATGKYLTSLLDVLGERLLFPETFVGRGDMSRGGLLLRAAASGDELAYRPVVGATLTGARPAKLGPSRRAR